MSVDVDVIPTADNPISWGALKQHLFGKELPDAASRLLGPDPQLIHLGIDELVPNDQLLRCGSWFYFRLAERNTLSLGLYRNECVYIDEHIFVEDFGRNLTTVNQRSLAESWKAVGYTYGLTSFGGRHADESHVLVALAASLAELSAGCVVVSESAFDLPVGVYAPDEFRHAVPRF